GPGGRPRCDPQTVEDPPTAQAAAADARSKSPGSQDADNQETQRSGGQGLATGDPSDPRRRRPRRSRRRRLDAVAGVPGYAREVGPQEARLSSGVEVVEGRVCSWENAKGMADQGR